MKPSVPPSIAEGTMINEYRVGKCLGRGSMGEVYEGRHETRRVALKVLREGADDQLNAGRRLLEEARSVNAIRHPGIVEVLDIGLFTDRRPFLVMELLEGASLSARIKSSPVQWQEAVKWLDGILDALDAAHRAGVVHRDLKPSNVFLVGKPGDERVKILDFGLPAAQAAKRTSRRRRWRSAAWASWRQSNCRATPCRRAISMPWAVSPFSSSRVGPCFRSRTSPTRRACT